MFFTFFVFIFTFFQFTARVYLQWNSVSKKLKFPNNYISSYFLSNNPFWQKRSFLLQGDAGGGGHQSSGLWCLPHSYTYEEFHRVSNTDCNILVPSSKCPFSQFFCGWLESIDQRERNKKLKLTFFEIFIS